MMEVDTYGLLRRLRGLALPSSSLVSDELHLDGQDSGYIVIGHGRTACSFCLVMARYEMRLNCKWIGGQFHQITAAPTPIYLF